MTRLCVLAWAGLASLALVGCGGSDGDEPIGSGGTSTSGPAASGTPGAGGAAAGPTTSAGPGGAGGGAGGTGTGGGSTNNGFPAHWIDGTNCGSDPEVQVWQYDDDTFILRQSPCTYFEANFLYVLFGEDKVLLQDTGTGDAAIQPVVQGVIDQWLATKGKTSIPLEVTHSHSHGDHIGGDSQFQGKPNTTVVGTSVGAVEAFFGITNWPTQIVEHDLGGRILDVIPIPGHQSAHIALYDRRDHLLLTGDTLYAGRLYVSDWGAYQASIPRMVDFVNANHPLEWVLGTHIEMTTTPGQDYPMGANQHPNEHVLQLTEATLLELDQGVKALGNNPHKDVHDDFIIYPL